MRQKQTLLCLALLALAPPSVAAPLDPQPDFGEFHGEVAVRPSGETLLTWTRQQDPGGPWTAMAATLEPGSGQLGSLHEWGAGGAEQVVPLASGYLALRQDVLADPNWIAQHLDDSGEPVGPAIPLGYTREAVVHATPDGGAVIVTAGASLTGLAQGWRIGPDGALRSGPTKIADLSLEAAVGVDAAGNVIVAWTDQGTHVLARRFSPDLQPTSPVLNVAPGGARGIRLAVAPDGRFVVVFVHSSSFDLYSRAYRANGSVIGRKRLISPSSELVMQEDFDVALGQNDRILVAWKTSENSSIPVIRVRTLALDGRPLTKVSRLARITGGRGEFLRPRVERLPGRDFFVLWSRVEADGQTVTLQSRLFAGR